MPLSREEECKNSKNKKIGQALLCHIFLFLLGKQAQGHTTRIDIKKQHDIIFLLQIARKCRHMRIVVFSDSHGNIRHCAEAIERIKDVDMIIHLGDILKDVEALELLYPNITIEYVAGNNEFRNTAPYNRVLEIEGKKIFITHGHLYRVKYEYDTIVQKGKSLKADVILFGHTHEGYEAYKDGMFILNPGSISLPKWGKASYGVIEIQDGKIGTCICNV